MTDLYGNYRSQTTRALQSIDSSKFPDTNKDFEKNIQRLNNFVDYIAEYLQVMQKGVDKANQDPITNLRNTITDLGILLAGGELLYGIDLGDLQYFLPAIAAMFGFDSDKPFPINLLYAAEHFLLGYIIPLDSWAYAIMDIIDAWAIAFGLPADFVEALHNLLLALQAVTTDYIDYFNGLANLITIFDVSSALGDVSGPLGQLWAVLRTLFGEGNDLPAAIDLLGPAGNALAPWVQLLADLVTNFDLIVKAFAAGAYDIAGLLNLGNMITNVVSLIPLIGTFDPVLAWAELFTNALTAAVIPNLDASKIVSGIVSAARLQPLIDAVSVGFGGSTGLGYSGLQSWLAGLPTPQAVIDYIYNTLTGGSGSGHSLTDLGVALIAFPANFISGILDAAVVPGLDASKIITGILPAPRLQGLVDAVSQAYGGSPGLGYAALQSYLAGLPTAQQVIDYIYNTLTGGSSSGHTLANLVSALSAYPASLINGVLASINIPSLDASKIVTGIIAQARAAWAVPIDVLAAAWGATGTGLTTTDLAYLAQNIAPQYIIGLLGSSTVGGTIQNFLDAGVQAIRQNVGLVNNSIEQWSSTLTAMTKFLGFVTVGAAPTNSVAQITSFNSNSIAKRAVQIATSENLDPTMSPTFKLSEINTTGTLPTIAITQNSPAGGYIRIQDVAQKQSLGWLGYGTTNIVSFRVNISTVNPKTGALSPLYSSGNIIAGVGSGVVPVWNSLNFPALNYIDAAQGDLLYAEFVVVGSGTYNLVGKTLSGQLPQHPTAIPALPGATRSSLYSTPVAFDAIGAGNFLNGQSNTTLSTSWSHTASDGAYVVVAVASTPAALNSGILSSASATYGGTAMKLLGTRIQYSANGYGTIALFGIANVSAGAATVNVSMTGTTALGIIRGNSVSYLNVGNVQTISTSGSNTSALSLAANGAPGARVFFAYSSWVSTGDSMTGVTGATQRFMNSTAGGVNTILMWLGDTNANGAITWSATQSPVENNTWGAMSLVLSPKPAVQFDAASNGTTGPSSVPIVDAVGGGNFGITTNAADITWSHTIASDATALVVGISYAVTAGGVAALDAKCGATAMTQLGSVAATAGNGVIFFGLMNPPTGVQTISVGIAAGSGDQYADAGTSISYKNATGFGLLQTTTGTSANPTQSVSNTANMRLVQAITTLNTTGGGASAMTGYTQTSRYNAGYTAGQKLQTLIGDMAGAAGSVTGTANTSTSSAYASAMLPILGPYQWTHTATAGSTVLAALTVGRSSDSAGYATWTRTLTYDGVAMTSLGVVNNNNTATSGFTELFVLKNAPSGAKTIAVSLVGAGTIAAITGCSASYLNVEAVGAVGTGYGGSTVASAGPVTTGQGGPQLIVSAIGAVNATPASAAISSPSSITNASGAAQGPAELRATNNTSLGTWNQGVALIDAPGSISNTVTLNTFAASSCDFGSAYVQLYAAPADTGTGVPTPSANVPWCGLSGAAGVTQYSPVLTPMMDAGSVPYSPPSWANKFDVILWPGGASGTSGAGLVGGFGGNGSSPTTITLTKEQISGANWTWTNGAGGAATAPYGVPGNNGAQSNVVIPGYGMLTATAVGTGNGSTSDAAGLPGGAAAGVTVNGQYYPGGAGGGSPQAAGQQPGGGGAGGNATYSTYVGGGAGGYGGGYVLAYQ